MTNTATGAEFVRRRDKRRAARLRPTRIPVAGTRATGFAEQSAWQARLILEAEAPEGRAEDEAWFEVSDKTGWTA